MTTENTPKPTPPASTTPPTPAPQPQSQPEGNTALLDKELEALIAAEKSRWSVDDAVRALLQALELDETSVRALDIRSNGIIRIIGTDNSGRTARFTALERTKPETVR
jgi:hypothetical protein